MKEQNHAEENGLVGEPKKKNNKNVGCLSIIGAVVVALLIIQFVPGFVVGFKNGLDNSKKSSSFVSSVSIQITKGKYNKLHDGMTYNEVCKALGSKGKQEADAKASGYSYSSYIWGSGMKTVIVTFENGKANTISETGLD